MPVRIRQIFLNLLGCIGLIGLPFLFFPHPAETLQRLSDPATKRNIIGQLLLIVFFYLNYLWLIPKFYFIKKYSFFAFVMLFCFAVYLLLPSAITHYLYDKKPQDNFSKYEPPSYEKRDKNGLPPDKPTRKFGTGNEHQPPPPGKPDNSFPPEYGINVFLFLAVLFFSLSLAINNRWKKVEREKTDAELAYLKAQVNPHFLFNVLNSIYLLTIQKSDEAPDAVIKLAGMMRYVLHEADKEFVSLEREVNYIQDYIALQMLRFGDAVRLHFKVIGETSGKKIAPLLLISFIENAFKHGVNAEENAEISIEINITESTLYLRVRNNKVFIKKLDKKDESGLGLQNVKNRLQLLYGGNYELKIDDNEKSFLITLKLQLT